MKLSSCLFCRSRFCFHVFHPRNIAPMNANVPPTYPSASPADHSAAKTGAGAGVLKSQFSNIGIPRKQITPLATVASSITGHFNFFIFSATPFSAFSTLRSFPSAGSAASPAAFCFPARRSAFQAASSFHHAQQILSGSRRNPFAASPRQSGERDFHRWYL